MELFKDEYEKVYGEPAKIPSRRVSRFEIQQKERLAWAEFQQQKRE